MKKEVIIEALMDELHTSKKDAEKILKAVSDFTQQSLALHGEAILPGIGKIKVKQTKTRLGRNPKTGASLTIEARNKIVFTPAKDLRDAMPELAH